MDATSLALFVGGPDRWNGHLFSVPPGKDLIVCPEVPAIGSPGATYERTAKTERTARGIALVYRYKAPGPANTHPGQAWSLTADTSPPEPPGQS